MHNNILSVFQTIILKEDKFFSDEFLTRLATLVLEEEKHKTNYSNKSLIGKNGWHSNTDLNTRGTELSNCLNTYIEKAVNKYMSVLGAQRTWALEDLYIVAWAMVMRGQDWSFPHTHGGADLSGVFYIDVPPMEEDQGNLVLIDPRGGARGSKLLGSQIYRIKPQVGTMVVFPSWLDHYVEPHDEGLRLSIAWNVNFKSM